MDEEVECHLCHQKTKEYCADLVCRACHKAESLQDCLGNKQVNEIRASNGLQPI